MLIFLISIPLSISFNYFVVMHLLDFINFFGAPGYIFSLLMQFLGWFEILVFFFDKWKKSDKIVVINIYYLLFLFCLLARPVQLNMIFNLNPSNILKLFNSFNEIIVSIFNIGIFIPMITVNDLFISKLRINIYICILMAFLIEILQVVLHRGIFDICDIILYIIGIGFGVIVYRYVSNDKLNT